MHIQFDKAKHYFWNGQYKEAEQLLIEIRDEAQSVNDQVLYVNSLIWRNRILINMMRYEELYQQLLLLNPLVSHYAKGEELYLFKSQLQLFNTHYFIGDTMKEFQLLCDELRETPYTEQYFISSCNLILMYLDDYLFDEAYAVYQSLAPLAQDANFTHRLALYLYYMHGFVIYYEKRDFDMCQQIIQHVETDERILIVESLSLTLDITKAMLDAQLGQICDAKQRFTTYLQLHPTYFRQVRIHLKLWIRTLEEFQLKDDIIACQHLMIQLLLEQYTTEIKNLRKESIEHYSKQFYETQIYTDQMTGVKNRNFFEGFIEKVQQVRTYCIAVLDIDYFKSINDTFGHAIGDEAIQFIAKQLSNWCPQHDIHIIRYGGDEFVLLMPYAHEKMAQHMEQLHDILMTTPCITSTGEEIPMSVSIGLCHNDEKMVDLHTLFKQADDMLYEAKKTRGRLVQQPFCSVSI
ncbi:MAG: GGDEF domain-containing protein [Caryophanon sp.]|nr:GGDEF domain-containing protein [Caryophanon sp.]